MSVTVPRLVNGEIPDVILPKEFIEGVVTSVIEEDVLPAVQQAQNTATQAANAADTAKLTWKVGNQNQQ